MPSEVVPVHSAVQVAQQAERPESTDLLAVIARAAADPAVDVGKMAALLEMQERVVAKQAELAFNSALARLQPRLPRILKRGKIEFKGASQPYAKYEDIDEAIRPMLHQEGFALSFGTRALETGGILVTATLAHVLGHSRSESMPLPFDTSGSKNSIQAVGSTISYGKRYLVCAMLNIITVGEDDDGQALSVIDERQLNNILDMQAACEMDAESQSKFLSWAGVKALADIRCRDYEKCMGMLRAKLKKQNEGRT